MHGKLEVVGDPWDSPRVNDFMALAAAMLLVAIIPLRVQGLMGASLGGASLLLAVPAYAVTVLRGRRDMLVGAAGLVAAASLGWVFARVTGTAWAMDWLALAWLLAVWVPWPTLHTRLALLVLWALSVGPLLLLLAGPPWADVSWIQALVEGYRISGRVGFNEIGIPAALSVVALLALRLERDTWVRFILQGVMLVIAAGAGTRAVLPALVVAAMLWARDGRRLGVWRGWGLEALPWGLYGVVALRTMVLRTVQGLSAGAAGGGLASGVDRASSNRGAILGEYWEHARTTLLGGQGVGATEALRDSGVVSTPYLPHNGFMTLVIDVGIPAMIVATVALVVYVGVRAREVDGAARWLLRVPLVVILPSLFLLDHGLVKAYLTLPIMLFAAAAPWVSHHVAERSSEPVAAYAHQ